MVHGVCKDVCMWYMVHGVCQDVYVWCMVHGVCIGYRYRMCIGGAHCMSGCLYVIHAGCWGAHACGV